MDVCIKFLWITSLLLCTCTNDAFKGNVQQGYEEKDTSDQDWDLDGNANHDDDDLSP